MVSSAVTNASSTRGVMATERTLKEWHTWRHWQQRIPVIFGLPLCMPTLGFVEAPRARTHRAPVSGYLAGSVPVRLAVALVHKDFKSGSRLLCVGSRAARGRSLERRVRPSKFVQHLANRSRPQLATFLPAVVCHEGSGAAQNETASFFDVSFLAGHQGRI